MKQSNPAEVAELFKARIIDKKSASKWWVGHTLKKHDIIIVSVKFRLKKKTHNYGIEVPTIIEHFKPLHKKYENTLWMDALKMEMDNAELHSKF